MKMKTLLNLSVSAVLFAFSGLLTADQNSRVIQSNEVQRHKMKGADLGGSIEPGLKKAKTPDVGNRLSVMSIL